MDLKEKVLKALAPLEPEYVRLEEDDGISGYLVTRKFKGVSSFDRQGMIDEALQKASLERAEWRQILMIAGLTPEEYDAVGAKIRVHRIKEMAGGAVEIVLHGGVSDAEYVRGALNHQKGVQTSDPKPVGGAAGVLFSFRAKGNGANPLTKEKVVRALKKDQYIEVATNA